jgi:catechol 2,3-dioxygenase-like lactoylglutathione lyase family enzyme
MTRVPVTFPHHDAEEGGYAVLLMDPRSGIAIGLDHISFGVADRAGLDAWASRLDELGIGHSGVIDTDQPMPYSVLVFRDPDNLQPGVPVRRSMRCAVSPWRPISATAAVLPSGAITPVGGQEK